MCERTAVGQFTRYGVKYTVSGTYKGYMTLDGRWEHQCEHCGLWFTSDKASGVKYGSAKCRVAASRKRNKGSKHKTHCKNPSCGKEIMSGGVNFGNEKKYCSNACRQKVYRDSRKSLV